MQKNDSIGMTKRSYMEAVMEGLRAVSTVDVAFVPHNVDAGSLREALPVNDMCNGTRKKIYVRLLLSIDRRESTAAAMETVCMNRWSVRIVLSLYI
jgi:adenosine deaminase